MEHIHRLGDQRRRIFASWVTTSLPASMLATSSSLDEPAHPGGVALNALRSPDVSFLRRCRELLLEHRCAQDDSAE